MQKLRLILSAAGVSLATVACGSGDQLSKPADPNAIYSPEPVDIFLGDEHLRIPRVYLGLAGNADPTRELRESVYISMFWPGLLPRSPTRDERTPGLVRIPLHLSAARGASSSALERMSWATVRPRPDLQLEEHISDTRVGMGWLQVAYRPLDRTYVTPTGETFWIACKATAHPDGTAEPYECAVAYRVSDTGLHADYVIGPRMLADWRAVDTAIRNRIQQFRDFKR